MLVNVVLAALSAGAIGDAISESELFDKFRMHFYQSEVKINKQSTFFKFITCRFCVSGWAVCLTYPVFVYGVPVASALLCIAAAWKISTALRGMNE